MRTLFGVMAALFLALGTLSCNREGGSAGSTGDANAVKIGFLVKQPDMNWFQNEWKFADLAGAKDGFQVIKLGATDGPRTLAAIDNLAAQGAKGFVICTPDVKLGQAILDRADRYHMKVMSVDDQFQDSEGNVMQNVHHMGITAKDIGYRVGKALADEMKKRNWTFADSGAAILTYDEFDTARERTEGAIAALKEAGFPEDRMFKSPEKDTNIAGGRDAMNAALTRHSEVKNWLIAGINDDTVVGGLNAAENRGFSAEQVIAVGIGGDAGIPQFQQETPTGFVASVLISPKRHGYETAELMYRWIKDGVEPPMTTWTQGILIDRDNYKQMLKEQGLD
jgi:L-arabinose transport system substrate-binding protein